MPTRQRKHRRMRGHRTVGYGQISQHRRHPGGRGHAGLHKYKWSWVTTYDPDYFGVHGFVNPTTIATDTWISVGDLDSLYVKLAEKGKAGPAVRTLAPGIAVARAAAAVMVEEELPLAPADASGIEAAILYEVRSSLRGTDENRLASAVSAPARAVAAALEALKSRGALVRRGERWFMA